jgi:hypothetical protein
MIAFEVPVRLNAACNARALFSGQLYRTALLRRHFEGFFCDWDGYRGG